MYFETHKPINLIMKSNEAEGNKVSTCWWGMDEHFPCTATVKLSSVNICFQVFPKRNHFRRDNLPVKFKRCLMRQELISSCLVYQGLKDKYWLSHDQSRKLRTLLSITSLRHGLLSLSLDCVPCSLQLLLLGVEQTRTGWGNSWVVSL